MSFESLEVRHFLCGVTVDVEVERPPAAVFPQGDALAPDLVQPGLVAAAPAVGERPLEYEYSASGLPLLDSRPGAPVAVYLDFDGFSGAGFGGPTVLAGYDVDGDATTFGQAEQDSIIEAWRRTAAIFSPFDVNVTTSLPTVPFSWSVVTSNPLNEGYSWGRFNEGAPSAVNPQEHLLERTSAIVHEAGHNFGLAHLAEFDLLGNQTREYQRAIDELHAPIMGSDSDGIVSKWWIGHPAGFPHKLQDDVDVIAEKVRAFQGPSGNGFRPDDHGDDFASARPLEVVGGIQTGMGIIERLDDVDVFSFVSSGGGMAIDAKRYSMSSVDLKLEIFAADGELLAAADTESNDQILVMALPAGTYFAAVSSHGDYGDIGTYSISVVGAEPPIEPERELNGLPAPDLVSVGLETGNTAVVLWSAVPGASGYEVERSSDGIGYSVMATAPADVGTFVDSLPASHQRYFYRVRAADANGVSPASRVHDVLSRPNSVSGLTLTSLSETQLVLNWLDVSGDAGYRIERSFEGGPFAAIASVGVNVPSFTDGDLIAGGAYAYRVVTLDRDGDAATSGIAVGSTRPSAVTDLTLDVVAADGISLSWSDIHGETEYRVYRRTNEEFDFELLATLPTDTTSFVDATTAALNEYYYYVQGMVGIIPGNTVLPAFTATPGGPLEAPWVSVAIGPAAGGGAAGFSDGHLAIISGSIGIDAANDAAFYVYRPLRGDGEIVARIAELEFTLDFAKAGLMIRESLATDSAAFVLTTTAFGGEELAYRSTPGSDLAIAAADYRGAQWLKVERTGDLFSGYTSVDGATWEPLGEAVVIEMDDDVLVGLASFSNSDWNLYRSAFDNIVVRTAGVPGDFDGDGRVGASDVDVFLGALAIGSTEARFDFTNDGIVDLADLDAFVRQYVETASGVGTHLGDINLDGRVDRSDARRLAERFGSSGVVSWERGDFDASGTTDLSDLAILQLNMGLAGAHAPMAAVVRRARSDDPGSESANRLVAARDEALSRTVARRWRAAATPRGADRPDELRACDAALGSNSVAALRGFVARRRLVRAARTH